MEEVRREGSRVSLLAQGGRKEGGQQGKPAGASGGDEEGGQQGKPVGASGGDEEEGVRVILF